MCFRQTPEQQLVLLLRSQFVFLSSRRSRTVTKWKKKRWRRKEGAARRRGGEAEAPDGAPLHHHLIMPHLTQHYRCIMGSEGGGRGDAELHEYLIKHETTKRRSSRDEEVINIPSGRHADPARRNSSLSSPRCVHAARSPLALFRPKSTKLCGVKRRRKSWKTTEEEHVRFI